MLKAEGFDEAIIGQTYDMAVQEERLIYSVEKCVDILIERDGMTREEALDYMYFNAILSTVSKDQPIFLNEEYDYDVS
jgi:hypothetical protein|tara:strand:- start:158 stop:391 length:234 start_codon:yes stop_codon:yes gene_type:complete